MLGKIPIWKITNELSIILKPNNEKYFCQCQIFAKAIDLEAGL